MQLSKHFFKIFCLGCIVNMAAAAYGAQTLAECMEQGKATFAAKQYPQAAQQFNDCLAIDAKSVAAQLSLAGVLFTQEDLAGAQTHFEQALKNMEPQSPYRSYAYSMLGDIALKQKDQKQALKMYQKSLEYNDANVNSLVGKGVILETQGDKKEAAQSYKAALAVEPLNTVARERLVALEPDYLSDEEILTALKQRYAIKPEVSSLTQQQRDLFKKIHLAEQQRGVDYLKNKYGKKADEYVVTLNKDTDFSRQMLTLNGYNTLQKDIAQDAVSTFGKLKIPVQDVFDLRDKQGNPVFTKDSTLTAEGFYVYTQALAGKKEYLLPNQPVPLTEQQLQKARQRAKALAQKGYAEISHAELKFVEEQTLCSQDTLKDKLGVYFLPIAKKQYRYFVRITDDNALKTVPYYYVMLARQKRNPKLEVPKNETVEYYKYYGYTVCLSDGNLTLQEQ